MSIRLIVSDVDGTILPRGGALSDRTRAAVKACEEHNVPFVISSGRWFVAAKKIADELNMEKGYMIVANGGAVVHLDGTPLKQWVMPESEARRAYAIMKKYDVMMNSYVPNAVYRVNTGVMKRQMRGLDGYMGDDYFMVNNDWERFENEALKDVYKLEVYIENAPLLAQITRELEEAGFAVSSAYWDNIEITMPGCGKGNAVRWLCEHLGVEKDECMGFGDNTNDQTMLEATGWPVAVENAVESLKKCARIVCPPCDQDGVAQTIEKALRGEIG